MDNTPSEPDIAKIGQLIESDSANYSHSFFGILNKQGQFWTPLAFESEAKARQHIVDFWGGNKAKIAECLASFKIVPVRIRLEANTHD